MFKIKQRRRKEPVDFLGTCEDLVIMLSEQAVLGLAVLCPLPVAQSGGGGQGSTGLACDHSGLCSIVNKAKQNKQKFQICLGLCSSLYLTRPVKEELKQ